MAAMAAESQDSSDDIAVEAYEKLKNILDQLGKSSPLQGDALAIDLSSLSREEIFAIASNSGNLFTDDEQKAASMELEQRFDAALSGGYALMTVTGNYADLYSSALEYLENAGSSERESATWQAQYAAVKEAGAYLASNPGSAPADIEDDPVADYLARVADGSLSGKTDMDALSSQARAVLDSIGSASDRIDELTKFGNQSLSAIALNTSGSFTSSEVMAAKHEMQSRVGAEVQSAFQLSGASGDPTDFSKRLIAQYSSMSAEERQAAGLDDNYYDAIVSNYQTSMQISQAMNTGPQMMAGTSAAAGSTTSLLNFL